MTDRQPSLLEAAAADDHRPLADRMRPQTLDDYCGQSHLLGAGAPLRRVLEGGALHSMVFWGPPGTGKTTLARLIAQSSDAVFLQLSAVLSGVKEIRAAVSEAAEHQLAGRQTVLFVDEVHRFNKSQQDAFLPHIEDGTIVFLGATTENPAFELNNALLSRVRTYVLKSLDADDIAQLLQRALTDAERGLGTLALDVDADALARLAVAADGDARRALSLLELAAALAEDGRVDEAVLAEAQRGSLRRFDKGGDAFYDQISALHKSVRGSDPDASLYWLCRMLDGGCDPQYIARRVVRIASEDIGNADPRALEVSMAAWHSLERLGSPEGELALAQAVVYCAAAAKSNAVYTAYKAARQLVAERGSDPVPDALRNAPTALAREMGHSEGYRYAHDEPDAFAAGMSYFPEALGNPRFYEPVERGLELRIGEKLAALRARNAAARGSD